MPVTYGDIVRADLMALDKAKKRSKCCQYPIYTDNKGNRFCSQCLKNINEKNEKKR